MLQVNDNLSFLIFPQVEQAVTDEIMTWEKEHGRTFLVNGMPFIKYIEKTWKDFEDSKQREKEERVGSL